MTVTLRIAKSKEERLFAALGSGDNDIIEGADGNVYVTGKNKDGELIELGCIGVDVFFSDRSATNALIENIRFGPHRAGSAI
jgi:hypothetical protein